MFLNVIRHKHDAFPIAITDNTTQQSVTKGNNNESMRI